MSYNTWVKVPATDINSGVLKKFTSATMGSSIAAMKIYIALLTKTNNDEKFDTYSFCNPSLSELEQLTGLSRTLVVAGINMLEQIELIKIQRSRGRENYYQIGQYNKNPWGKIPKQRFTNTYKEIGGKVLHDFRARGKINLNALKIFLYLSVSVDRKTGCATRTYETIEIHTGVRRNDINVALSLLYEYKLIGVKRQADGETSKTNTPNSYYILGIQIEKNTSET